MGIEKFFNTIKKSYGNKIITKIEPNTYFPNNHLFLDFNSIIHIISQSVTNSIIYLYHIYNLNLHVFNLYCILCKPSFRENNFFT